MLTVGASLQMQVIQMRSLVILVFLTFHQLEVTGKNESVFFNNRENAVKTCGWANRECILLCSAANATLISQEVNSLMETLPTCLNIRLSIQTIYFNQTIMNSRWYSGDTPIRSLVITDANIIDIEPDAFNTDAFKKTRELQLFNFQVQVLRSGVLNGLNKLQYFRLEGVKLRRFEANFFGATKYLNSVIMSFCTEYTINLDGALGTDILPKLLRASLNNNDFNNTITAKTFAGLTAIQRLHLENSQITVIGEYAFDPIASTLEVLNLSRNRLKTLPPNLFIGILSAHEDPYVQIYLENNPWDCNCDLVWLKMDMMTYLHVFCDYPCCTTPIFISNLLIQVADFCSNENSSTSKLSPGWTTSTTLLETTTKSSTNPFRIKCKRNTINNYHVYSFTAIQKPVGKIAILKLSEEAITIFVRNFPRDSVVFIYESNAIDLPLLCNKIRNIESMALQFKFTSNKSYMGCVMQTHSKEVSPLNCISFHTFSREYSLPEMWLPKNDRITIIIVLIGTYVVSVTIGLYVILLIVRQYPKLMPLKKRRLRSPHKETTNNFGSMLQYSQRHSSSKSKSENQNMSLQCQVNGYEPPTRIRYMCWENKQQNSELVNYNDDGYISTEAVPPLLPPRPRQLKHAPSQRNSSTCKTKSEQLKHCCKLKQ